MLYKGLTVVLWRWRRVEVAGGGWRVVVGGLYAKIKANKFKIDRDFVPLLQ